jgi:hypothetical protein
MKQKSGKIRNSSSFEIDGITFKSRLESYCFKRLKEEGIPFNYENYVFVLQESFTSNLKSIELIKTKGQKNFGLAGSNIREITYKPDFVSMENNWIIECKGFATDNFNLKWKMFKHFLYRNNMNVTLYVPRNQKQIDLAIELIKNGTK